jgi:azurin
MTPDAPLTRRPVIACLGGLLLAGCGPARAPTVQLHIASDGDEMLFVPDRLSCPQGAHVRLTLHHAGQILSDPHNWVLLKPGTEAAFVADCDRNPSDNVPIPPGDEDMVIVSTPYCRKGESVTIGFDAPPAGRYPFVCSFPGHGHTMHGILTVTASNS